MTRFCFRCAASISPEVDNAKHFGICPSCKRPVNFVDFMPTDENIKKAQAEMEKLLTFNIPVLNSQLTVKILGKNKFKIISGDETICSPTKPATVVWWESPWYRIQIAKDVAEFFNLKETEAKKIAKKICNTAEERSKKLDSKSAHVNPEEEFDSIIDDIEKTTITRSEDGNIYHIYINEEIIRLTDKEMYDGGRAFCLQYFNRFLKKIIISNEEWNDIFLPYLLSENVLMPKEEKLETMADIVIDEFLQYILNKKTHDWDDIHQRVGHHDSLYFDKKKNQVRISSVFINKFFDRGKIQIRHKINTLTFASYLREDTRKYLLRTRMSGRVGKRVQTFWVFDPQKLSITKDDILEKPQMDQPIQPEKKIESFGEDADDKM